MAVPRTLRSAIKRLPILRRLLAYLGLGQPGTWLFQRAILEQLWQSSIKRQLPLALRWFAACSRWYFWLFPKATDLAAGLLGFRLSRLLLRHFTRRDLWPIELDGERIYLDLADPRFINVIAEIRGNSETKALQDWLSEGDTFIDVGANQGGFSIVAARHVGTTGRIFAIEPQPRLARAVTESLRANAACFFRVFSVAVGDSDGSVDIFVPKSSSGSAGIYPDLSATHDHDCVHVPLKRLDGLINEDDLRGETVVKVDIEGSELSFLKGAAALLAARTPRLFIELNPKAMMAAHAGRDELVETLLNLGYDQYVELNQPHERIPLGRLEPAPQRNVIVMSSGISETGRAPGSTFKA